MEFGTFLLPQSPAAEPPEVIYGRGVEITQAAESLGFGNMWLAEHHFSTYGYLSRPLTCATTSTAASGSATSSRTRCCARCACSPRRSCPHSADRRRRARSLAPAR